MDNYQVDVSKKEWLFIILLGSGFGLFFGGFSSYLLKGFIDFPITIAGGVIGFSTTLVAFLAVPLLNILIIPGKNFFLSHFLGFLVSFVSGFVGFINGYFFLEFCCEESVNFIKDPLTVAIITGVLAYAIGVILYFFHYHKNQEKILESMLTKERLATLESQLNPHFVHNTLNVLAELAHKDANRAEDGILLLSKMLRTIIDEESHIPLFKELNYIKEYIEIVKLQHQEKISLKIKNPESINCGIPKFSVQLLVENALKYGFVDESLVVEIFIFLENGFNKIVVCNLANEIKDLKKGVGLRNLESRLKFLNRANYLEYNHKDGKNCFEIGIKDEI